MANNKEAFIQSIVSDLNAIDPNNPSIKIIADSIRSMNKEQFENYIQALENGVSDTPDYSKPREFVPLVLRNDGKSKITIEGNIALAKKWGYDFFQRVWMVDPITRQQYLTNFPYMIVDAPVMRQAQTLEKKIAVADGTTRLDTRTNQISDSAKGASLSSPELQSLLSQGRKAVAIELMKFRGGDDKAYRTMASSLLETGTFYQSSYQHPTRAKSTDITNIYLKAMHLDNDL